HQDAIEEAREPPAGGGGELRPMCPWARGAFLEWTATAIVDHRGNPIAHLVSDVDRMIGPVEPLKRPLFRGSMVAGLGFVLREPHPILDGLDLLSRTGLA